jgi:hypothetical protein
MLGEGAVAAYDRIPFKSGEAVFTLNTATQMLLLHSFNAAPVGGGHLTGQGQMWTSPEAEMNDSATHIELHGRELPLEQTLRRYSTSIPGQALPPTLLATLPRGSLNMDGTLVGSQLAPTFQCAWGVPQDGISGHVRTNRQAAHVTVKAPSVDLVTQVDTCYAPFEAMLRARTQEDAIAVGTPIIEGLNVDCTLHGVDLLPLVAGIIGPLLPAKV